MPDAHVDWLAKHTFACPRLGTTATPARVSPEMCQANRANALSGSTCAACDKDGMWEVYQAGDIPTPPRSEENPQAKETKEVSTMPTGYKTCPECSTEVAAKTAACMNCGYDFKAKAVPNQNEPEKASSAVVAENATTEPEETKESSETAKKPNRSKQSWKQGMQAVQINLTTDDPLYVRLNATAEQYGVTMSRVAEWSLRGLQFEMVEPEPVKA